MGTVLSVEAGEVAFFEGEDGEGSRCLLIRDARRRALVARFLSGQ